MDRTTPRSPHHPFTHSPGHPLAGAYTALVTPFSADGSTIDLVRLRQNIDEQAIAGMTGVVPCGTTGEAPTLTGDEYCSVVEAAIDNARPQDLKVIAGAGSNSTAHAVELHRFVAAAGADAALHVTPYYNRPSQEGLYRHFMTLADAVELPIVVYHIPGRTCVRLETATLARLAQHPNIVAVKDATGSLAQAEELLATTKLVILSGDDPLTLPLLAIGGHGVISVVGNVMPQHVAAMCHAAARNDWQSARAQHVKLRSLAAALVTLDVNPVPIKAAMQMLGRDSGALRPPLVEATELVKLQLRRLLEECTPATRIERVTTTLPDYARAPSPVPQWRSRIEPANIPAPSASR